MTQPSARAATAAWTRLALLAALLLPPAAAQAQAGAISSCGNPFRNHYGPFDYRKAGQEKKRMVEGAHFTPGVESMTKPSKTTFREMAGDVAYTLHVFPNHHRALITMTRLGERYKTAQAPGAPYTVDCYYQRAVTFTPDDTVVRALYAQFLAKNNQRDMALQQLAVGVHHAGDSPISHFNLGLVYFDLGEYGPAQAQAKRARALGMPRMELIDRLKTAGRWTEDEGGEGAAGGAASSPAPGASAAG